MERNKEYRSLTLPTVIWNKKELTPTTGELIAQPLEPGFGITLGNALRRILLGGVEGSAVTSVIIKGVNNEFAMVPGVVQDVMQLVLNIKEIVVGNKTGQPGTMRGTLKGEGTLTVGDLVADEHLEPINKDHVIAHVAQGGSLEIEFFVESGRGYQPAQWPETKPLQDDSRIYVDAMFSPVVNVTYDVQKTRVGKDIDYDKLIVRVTTDGSENPIEVVNYAVSVLRTQLEHFLTSDEIPFNQLSAPVAVEVEQEVVRTDDTRFKGISPDLFMKPIDELELSVRAHNCLINAGIKRLIDLVNLTEDEGLKIKNFGRKSLNEVKDGLKAFGLSLGMNVSPDDLKRFVEDDEE